MKYSFSRHEISCKNFAQFNSFAIVDASNFITVNIGICIIYAVLKKFLSILNT